MLKLSVEPLAFLGRKSYYLPIITMRLFPKTLKPLVSVFGRCAHHVQTLSLSPGTSQNQCLSSTHLSPGLAQLVISWPGAGVQEVWV